MRGNEMWVDVVAFGRTDQGTVRASNEDALAVVDLTNGERAADGELVDCTTGPGGVVAAVSDGMGGVAGGAVASAVTLDALCRELAGAGGDRAEALARAVERANREVRIQARERALDGMGATLVAAWIAGGEALVACVGDSRAYLLRRGAIAQVTRDQSYAEALVAAGVLSPHQAQTSVYRRYILQAIGGETEVVVALTRVDLRRGDCLVLCSDGLSTAVSDREIGETIAHSSCLAEACDRLVALANARGGRDNVTVLIARVDGDGLPAPGVKETVAETLCVLREFELRLPDGESTSDTDADLERERGTQFRASAMRVRAALAGLGVVAASVARFVADLLSLQ